MYTFRSDSTKKLSTKKTSFTNGILPLFFWAVLCMPFAVNASVVPINERNILINGKDACFGARVYYAGGIAEKNLAIYRYDGLMLRKVRLALMSPTSFEYLSGAIDVISGPATLTLDVRHVRGTSWYSYIFTYPDARGTSRQQEIQVSQSEGANTSSTGPWDCGSSAPVVVFATNDSGGDDDSNKSVTLTIDPSITTSGAGTELTLLLKGYPTKDSFFGTKKSVDIILRKKNGSILENSTGLIRVLKSVLKRGDEYNPPIDANFAFKTKIPFTNDEFDYPRGTEIKDIEMVAEIKLPSGATVISNPLTVKPENPCQSIRTASPEYSKDIKIMFGLPRDLDPKLTRQSTVESFVSMGMAKVEPFRSNMGAFSIGYLLLSETRAEIASHPKNLDGLFGGCKADINIILGGYQSTDERGENYAAAWRDMGLIYLSFPSGKLEEGARILLHELGHIFKLVDEYTANKAFSEGLNCSNSIDAPWKAYFKESGDIYQDTALFTGKPDECFTADGQITSTWCRFILKNEIGEWKSFRPVTEKEQCPADGKTSCMYFNKNGYPPVPWCGTLGGFYACGKPLSPENRSGGCAYDVGRFRPVASGLMNDVFRDLNSGQVTNAYGVWEEKVICDAMSSLFKIPRTELKGVCTNTSPQRSGQAAPQNTKAPTAKDTPVSLTHTPAPVDINKDGAVNILDYKIIFNHIIKSTLCVPASKCDVTGDGKVDTADTKKVLDSMGKSANTLNGVVPLATEKYSLMASILEAVQGILTELKRGW